MKKFRIAIAALALTVLGASAFTVTSVEQQNTDSVVAYPPPYLGP